MNYNILRYCLARLAVSCFVLLLVSCEDFIAEDVSQETLTINAPADQITTELPELIFWWEALNANTSYRLQIVTPAFENASSLILDTLVSTNQVPIVFTTGQYAWRVRAENANYRGTFSEVRCFTINNSATDSEQDGFVPYSNFPPKR